jgi:hypothetical protein
MVVNQGILLPLSTYQWSRLYRLADIPFYRTAAYGAFAEWLSAQSVSAAGQNHPVGLRFVEKRPVTSHIRLF